MGKRRQIFLAAVALGLLAGCAATSAYRPAPEPGEIGFSDSKLEADRYRIVFQGANGASPVDVTQLALRRAAELTVGQGAEWFVVDRQDLDAPEEKPSRVSVGIGGGGGSFGAGAGGGIGLDLTPRPGARVDLLIRTGAGAKPDGAYDARAILADVASTAAKR